MPREKIKFALRMSPETQQLVKEMYPRDNCRTQNEFIEKAIRFYSGYVSGQDACEFLPAALSAAMRGTIHDSENRICRLLFKLAVELDMAMNVLAAGMEIPREDLDRLRGRCVRDVKSTNGSVSLQDAVDYQKLLRDFPHCRELFEYEDYLASPTCDNASEFITRALEDNFDPISRRENYVDYIANRPRVERLGSHGLFTSGDNLPPLSQIAETVANHPGNVWLPIISLRREDAARLGYDNAGQWKNLPTSYAPQLADAMKIPFAQFRWYAAFHNEGHHPHVHMVCCGTGGKAGFLTKEGIANIKSGLAKEIFRQDLTAVYQQQTQRRDELIHEAGGTLTDLIRLMREGTLENPRIEQLMLELADRLKTAKGKKQYGYLQKPLKNLVDEIVDEVEKDPRVAAAYSLWYQLREEVLRTYRDNLPERLPLSRQKEFKRIKNLVIAEAVRLSLETAPLPQEDGSETEKPFLALPADAPPETHAPGSAEESPPAVIWSRRYKEARQLLYGSQGSPPDIEKARCLLLEEAQTGNALAMFDLGRLFSDGAASNSDSGQAQAWYAKALAAFQAVDRERPNHYRPQAGRSRGPGNRNALKRGRHSPSPCALYPEG